MGISSFADGILRQVGSVAETLTSPFSDATIRIGVTGLSRAGKTVFITSLVSNLLDRGRMPQFSAAPRITAAYLQPQPDDTIPRFPYEDHFADLAAPEPRWPEGTKRVSELRLSLKVQPQGLLAGISGLRTVHLDIIDYPGEWLLDLGLLEKSYEIWSGEVIARASRRPEAKAFLARLAEVEAGGDMDELSLRDLSRLYADYLKTAREAGYSDCTPGRFLLPGELEGSPVLTFAPLRKPENPAGRRSLWREAERRYNSYVKSVVEPFFRDHFSRIDRQIVLVDVLGAIHAGPAALEDLRGAMADILAAFRPGRNAFLTRIFLGRRVEKILFAATKADHLHHSQHARLTAITEALLREARDRAAFAGAETAAMSIAAVRATVEHEAEHEGRLLPMVRGKLAATGKQTALYAGDLPEDPQRLLSPARALSEHWLEADYAVMNFAPASLTLKPGDGLPHIRLDRAADFLLGDKL